MVTKHKTLDNDMNIIDKMQEKHGTLDIDYESIKTTYIRSN